MRGPNRRVVVISARCDGDARRLYGGARKSVVRIDDAVACAKGRARLMDFLGGAEFLKVSL